MNIPKYFYFRVKAKMHGTAIEVEDASNEDVVEVVRCKDCKHRPHIEKTITRYRQEIEVCAPMVDGREDYSCMCLNPDNSYFSWMPDDDWFCADGERREAE